ncbi:MAG: hypothetical protein H0W34_14965 [Pyrinomonadaceae bacterium]|nr:hypothetical protein [Pyrinomonadaceae bacterium]
MARRIELKPHLTTEELQPRDRWCQKPQQQVRWHALHLISQGVVAADAARRTRRASCWITSLARRSNRDGAAAVSRTQLTTPRHRAKVNSTRGKELDKALRTPAPDGGLSTGPKVAAWMTDKTGHEVHQRTGWRACFSISSPQRTPPKVSTCYWCATAHPRRAPRC